MIETDDSDWDIQVNSAADFKRYFYISESNVICNAYCSRK